MLNTVDFDLAIIPNGPDSHLLSFIDQTSPNLEEFNCEVSYAVSYIMREDWNGVYSKTTYNEVLRLFTEDPQIFEQEWIEEKLTSLFAHLRIQSQKSLPNYFYVESIPETKATVKVLELVERNEFINCLQNSN